MSKTNPKPFSPDQFTPTEFYSAEDKAKFGNNLVKFLLNGCQPKDFTKAVYQRLSNCFSHIAHYNQGGFYDVWFESFEKVGKWVDYVLDRPNYGDPAYTFSDVEREFQSWLREHRSEVFAALEPRLNEEQSLEANAGTDQTFRVVEVSSNTGAFGHKRHILVCRNGVAVTGDRQPSCHNPCNADLKYGDELTFTVDDRGMPTNWGAHNFEYMQLIPHRVPEKALKEVFGE